MRRKVLAWTLFLGSLLLLSLAATPYSRTADAALISARLTLLIVLSILVLRERWRNRHEPSGKSVPAGPTSAIIFCSAFAVGIAAN